MKNNSGMPVFLGLIGIIVMIAVFSAIGDADRENSKCLYTGCDNERAEDSIYCYRHKSSGKTYSDHHSSFQSSPSPSAQLTESPSYGSTRNNGSSYSKSYSGKGKNSINSDMYDYDNPDDYADDYAEDYAEDEFGNDKSESAYDYGYDEAYDDWEDEMDD